MKAIWIRQEPGSMNVAAGFRLSRDFPAGDSPALRLAAADSHRVWIDGRLAAHGPARTAHGCARVDVIPLDGCAGRRATLFIEVHSAHVPCFDGVEQDPFFAAEIVASDGRILAGTADFEAWRDGTLVQRVRRFSYQRGFVESRRLEADTGAFRRGGDAPEGWIRAATEPRETPRLLPRGVPMPALRFHAATMLSRSGIRFNPAAEAGSPREVTLVGKEGFKGFLPSEWEDDSALDAARLVWDGAEPVADGAPCAGLYDFGRIISGFFSLHVRAAQPAGATLLVVFGELRAPDGAPFPVDALRAGCASVVKWRLAPGDYDLLSFHPISARFAAVAVIDGAAEIDAFGMIDYENPDKALVPLPPTGDATLDEIVAAARETFAQNAVDVPTDCPSRERAGWLFDALFTGRAEALFTGRNVVERAFLENYVLAPSLPSLPAGMVPMCYPSEVVRKDFIPNWGLWWVLELASYGARTGDETIAAASRPKVEALLAYFRGFEGPEGLLEDLKGGVFVEWSPCNSKDHVCGVNFPSNFLYAAALDAAAGLLGDLSLAGKAAAVRETAARLAWNGAWFEDNAVRGGDGALRLLGHVTETGQYYAFYFDAASPETHHALWERLCAEFGPSRDAARTWRDVAPSNAIPGAFMRLELLLRHGRAGQCLDECRGFFAPMARTSGTLWENLDPGASLDHGFSSSAAWLIYRALRLAG